MNNTPEPRTTEVSESSLVEKHNKDQGGKYMIGLLKY